MGPPLSERGAAQLSRARCDPCTTRRGDAPPSWKAPMNIRTDQADTLRVERARQREVRLAEHLRDRHGDLVAGLSTDELLQRVRAGIRRAGAHGITWDSTLAAYLVLMFRAAPNFDEHPVVRAVLGHEELAPDLRLAALMEVTDDEHWEEIAAQRDESAWDRAPGERR